LKTKVQGKVANGKIVVHRDYRYRGGSHKAIKGRPWGKKISKRIVAQLKKEKDNYS